MIKTVVCTVVGPRLDYANEVLSGISYFNLNKFQVIENSLLNESYMLFFVIRCKRFAFRELHWLPVEWRFKFKVDLNDPEFQLPHYLNTFLTA